MCGGRWPQTSLIICARRAFSASGERAESVRSWESRGFSLRRPSCRSVEPEFFFSLAFCPARWPFCFFCHRRRGRLLFRLRRPWQRVFGNRRAVVIFGRLRSRDRRRRPSTPKGNEHREWQVFFEFFFHVLFHAFVNFNQIPPTRAVSE